MDEPRVFAAGPEVIEQPLGRHDLVRVQEQTREQCPLPASVQLDRVALLEHFQRPQNAKLHEPSPESSAALTDSDSSGGRGGAALVALRWKAAARRFASGLQAGYATFQGRRAHSRPEGRTMYSYHALTLLADAHRGDLLRAAQPRLRPVAPKRKRGGSLLSTWRVENCRDAVCVGSRPPQSMSRATGTSSSGPSWPRTDWTAEVRPRSAMDSRRTGSPRRSRARPAEARACSSGLPGEVTASGRRSRRWCISASSMSTAGSGCTSRCESPDRAADRLHVQPVVLLVAPEHPVPDADLLAREPHGRPGRVG